MIGVEQAHDVYPKILLEPHNITLRSVENLVVVNYNLVINAVLSPSEYPDR